MYNKKTFFMFLSRIVCIFSFGCVVQKNRRQQGGCTTSSVLGSSTLVLRDVPIPIPVDSPRASDIIQRLLKVQLRRDRIDRSKATLKTVN